MSLTPTCCPPASFKSAFASGLAKTALSAALGCFLLFALGCADRTTPQATDTPALLDTATATPEPKPSVALAATFTPLPRGVAPTPRQTAPVIEASPSETPLPPDFEETIVELRYSIPGLRLDRRMEGDKASRIIMADLTSGIEAEYRNQGGVLLELRQALPDIELDEVATGCDLCVYLEYELTLEGKRDSGWLQDEVMLASLENYFSVGLGSHFPPDTLLGLRRSASPYAPGHTLALTSDGQLWAWRATDARIPEPTADATLAGQLRLAMEQIPLDEVVGEYVVGCTGSSVETLVMRHDGEETSISIVCPEFSLPSTLLPLYLQLDTLTVPLLADVSLPRPPSAFPLASLLDYRRADGVRLTLFQDGTLVALDSSTAVTNTLAAAQVISLTGTLLDSDRLEPGLSAFGPTATPVLTTTGGTPPGRRSSTLVVRGPHGLVEGRWFDSDDASDLEWLDSMVNEMLGIIPPEPTSQAETQETLEATKATGTPSPEAAQTASASPTRPATGTPLPSATPTP